MADGRSYKPSASHSQVACKPEALDVHRACPLVLLLFTSCLPLVLLLFSSCFPPGLRRHARWRRSGATEPVPGFDSKGWAVIQMNSHFTFYICQPELAGIECGTCERGA